MPAIAKAALIGARDAQVVDGRDVVDFERDDLHREVNRFQGNGLAQRQTFDPVGRLLEQQLSRAGAAPAQMGVGAFKYQEVDRTAIGRQASILRQYRYDKAGQLTGFGDSRRGQIDYRYDPVGRLLQATSAVGAERFAFDPASNMVDAVNASHELARAQPVVNRVLDNLIKDYAGTHFQYDERGNLIERVHNGQRSTFSWDVFGRMTQSVTPAGITRYAYDPLGRRVAKVSESTA